MAKSALERQLEELEGLHKKGRLTQQEYDARRAAIVSGAARPPPVTAKRGGLFKWGALGCLGIFAIVGLLVIGLIVIIAVAASSSSDSSDTAATGGGDLHVTLAEGASGVIAPNNLGDRKSKVTILKIVDGAKSTNSILQPAAGKKYYAIQVEVESVGTKAASSLDWKLRDSTDAEAERKFISGVGDDLEAFYSDLTPGGKKQGWVVFEIAATATPKWIRADPNTFVANDLYFDAK